MLRDPRTGENSDDARAMELRFAERLPRAEGMIGKDGARTNRKHGLHVDLSTLAGASAHWHWMWTMSIILAGAASGGMCAPPMVAHNGREQRRFDISSVTTVAQDRRPGKRNVWYYGTGEFRAVMSGANKALW